ncbi:hypothetical protein ACTXT7_015315 [Hymenolepis weldensis]
MFPSPVSHGQNNLHSPQLQPQLRRKRRPLLEAFSAQMNPEQTSASGSLYEYNPAMMSQTTDYDGPGNLINDGGSVNHSGSNSVGETRVQPFSFACELAHGSNQVRISGFANIPELYQRIAESFSIPVSQIG